MPRHRFASPQGGASKVKNVTDQFFCLFTAAPDRLRWRDAVDGVADSSQYVVDCLVGIVGPQPGNGSQRMKVRVPQPTVFSISLQRQPIMLEIGKDARRHSVKQRCNRDRERRFSIWLRGQWWAPYCVPHGDKAGVRREYSGYELREIGARSKPSRRSDAWLCQEDRLFFGS